MKFWIISSNLANIKISGFFSCFAFKNKKMCRISKKLRSHATSQPQLLEALWSVCYQRGLTRLFLDLINILWINNIWIWIHNWCIYQTQCSQGCFTNTFGAMCHNDFFLFFFGQSGWASRWGICYQRGLPRLVFLCWSFLAF